MKRLSIVLSLILIIFSITKIIVKAPTPVNSLDGVYELHDEKEGTSGIVRTQMQITFNSPTTFNVKGIDQPWSGIGTFANTTGYYNWQFQSGESGETHIQLDKDGLLHGQVRSGIIDLNWDYVAVRKNAN